MTQTEQGSCEQSELVLALHEIGVSYRFGWGVEKNKKMVSRETDGISHSSQPRLIPSLSFSSQAVSYFILSADLGDMDAQQDVAFCFANGKGVKKDLKKAAHYYRLAVKQGGEDWGLSWIYKVRSRTPLILPHSGKILIGCLRATAEIHGHLKNTLE